MLDARPSFRETGCQFGQMGTAARARRRDFGKVILQIVVMPIHAGNIGAAPEPNMKSKAGL
jgi:hypothetical protein